MTASPFDPKLKDLFEAGNSWHAQREAQNAKLLRRAWWIAGIAAGIAALQALALVTLLPLKTVVPVTVMVDRQTGYATTVDPTRSADIRPDTALTRSMLAQYVVARESVDRATVAADYRKTVLWSGGNARKSYLGLMSANNPNNPYRRTPAPIEQVSIRSVSQTTADQAMVRFDLITQSASGQESARPYVANLRYKFRTRTLSEADRLVNPLGFEVEFYRRDPEALEPRFIRAANPVPVAVPQDAERTVSE